MPTLVDVLRRRDRRSGSSPRAERASLVIGNNVLAQVPDLNDFVAGVDDPARDDGTATFEFPHLLRLLDGLQYDTIYHEHFSYFSFATIARDPRAHGLEVYDVEELPTHGGSLRVYAQHAGGPHAVDAGRAGAARRARRTTGLRSPERYARFAEEVKESKRALLDLLIGLRREGKQVVGYGAPGQGQHAAQLLRHPHRPPRLHGRPQPVQARALHARDAHPDPSRPSGSRRRGPTTSSSCRGT